VKTFEEESRNARNNKLSFRRITHNCTKHISFHADHAAEFSDKIRLIRRKIDILKTSYITIDENRDSDLKKIY